MKPEPSRFARRCCGGALAFVLATHVAFAGPLLDRLRGREASQGQVEEEDAADAKAKLPPDVRVLRDIAYGDDARQRFDVYLPSHPSNAPVIVMVHGGAWAFGDKAMSRVVEAKVARWVPRGIVLVSVNYRMVPDAAPLEQARDVARAVAAVQARAAEWGGDRHKLVLMGHSAGAHLVSLLTAQPSLFPVATVPALGSVSLDSGAMDVTEIMQARHFGFYDRAFGSNPADWAAASPTRVLDTKPWPLLAVCSTRRSDSCPQADRFAARAVSLGGRASVLRQDLSHGEINAQLGQPGAYTDAVEAFLLALDPALAAALR
ncbi:hypothetical protein GCM10025771_22170 [Niveibacterium umoris]|uniref:Acetyl esterase/lipase n=1 Tax=Niveibacterium umoris TaxID=1193620 RepID=A0A840BJM3_9RHOO|nr:alpha/beta hydrolase [Niveibacterium umoris]MBB4012594.1 acetyl esterase/lipase [Niveibacterium umoris]